MPLFFCCEARLSEKGLKGSHFVSYAVSRQEFLSQAEKAFDGCERVGEQEVIAKLREKYYKIPKVFLSLIAQLALDERGREKQEADVS